MAENKGKAFDWDDECSSDGDFQLIPDGEYKFTVETFSKKWFNGSAKMCACNCAELQIRVEGADGPVGTIKNNLYLNEKCYGLFSAFFRAIGQKVHGEAFRPNWGAVPGSTGHCIIKTRTYKTQEGNELETNDIQFLDPPEQTSFEPKKESW